MKTVSRIDYLKLNLQLLEAQGQLLNSQAQMLKGQYDACKSEMDQLVAEENAAAAQSVNPGPAEPSVQPNADADLGKPAGSEGDGTHVAG